MSLRERRLVRRLRDRDESAFGELVETFQDQVFNLTYRMLGDRAEAEDVAQEVFITVFKSIDSFRGDSKLSTWLYRIAANHCKNRIKYLARRRDRDRSEFNEAVSGRPAAGAVTGPTQAPAPDAALDAAQREQLLQRAIAELDEDHRLLVVLRDIDELSYDEICAITGLPEGTVKSRLHRARVALRKKLAKHM
ncbi:MAG: sigma-70 family RNA polymerase sigma factor [Deltaproteobacteria bacterium]|nr:MAG: sigma-70 family RNA polymerase sigma factor [Deltaproteobacteria bacterium]